MAAGEVLLNGTQLDDGTTNSHASAPNLLDGNSLTQWSTFPGANQGWAGMDAGAPCFITRVRLSPNGGYEDGIITSTIQAAIDAAFAVPFKQGVANHINASSQASITAVYGAETAGNTNIVFIAISAGSGVIGVSDTANGAYTLVASGNNLLAYIRNNIASATAGTNTVTVSFSPVCNFPDVHIFEYQGMTASPFDGSASSSGVGTAVTSGPLTTTNAQDVLIAYMGGGGTPTHTAGPGFTMRLDESPWNVASADDGVNVTGTYTATFTQSTSVNWSCLVVAFKSTIVSPARLLTFANRPTTGTLLNEYAINNGGLPYQYYRFNGSNGNFGAVADLDFIVQYTPGVVAACVQPVITSPSIRQSDLPVVVTLSSITTDAIMYYTIDGSTPTTASTRYTGPFVISASCTFQAIATSTGLSNSRVTSTMFTIPSSIISNNIWYDNRNARVWTVSPYIFQDPISSWWYMYGVDFNELGVFTSGWIGTNIYKSADLMNWQFVNISMAPDPGTSKNSTNSNGRSAVYYNKTTKTYVAWSQGQFNNSGQHYQVFKAPSPEGPWKLFAQYNGLNGIGVAGDMSTFLDDDGVSMYIQFTGAGATAVFSKLNAAWDNVDNVNFNSYDVTSTFGIGAPFVNDLLDGPHMFRRGNTYYFLCNAQNNWVGTVNPYATASSPLGPWTNKGNPFIQQPGGGNGSPDYTIAYGGQNNYVVRIPGRNAWMFTLDIYNTGLANTVGTSTTANFQAHRVAYIPLSFAGGNVMSVNWNNGWTLDSAFPPFRGKPMGPTFLGIINGVAKWINLEGTPHALYLDFATDELFTQNARCELIDTIGGGQLTASYTPIFPVGPGFYRLRAINANGTSISGFSAPKNSPGLLATFAPSKARLLYNQSLLEEDDQNDTPAPSGSGISYSGL